MKKLFAALAFALVLLLAVTAELWIASLTGWSLALVGAAAIGICGRLSKA